MLKVLRRIFQGIILFAVLYLAFGFGEHSFENFCPFGGIESMSALVSSRQLTCAVSPWNFAVFFAVIGLTLAARKSFCGWVCPIGFLFELMARVQRRLFPAKRLPDQVDRRLRWLRYPVLVITLVLTWKTGELVLRAVDPYYLLFSGIGHGSAGWISVSVFLVLLLSGFFLRMSWCRYLCPMSAIMDLPAAVSPLTVRRRPSECTGCAVCDRACEHDLMPSRVKAVRHRDCTQCLNCLHACPQPGALELVVESPLRGNRT